MRLAPIDQVDDRHGVFLRGVVEFCHQRIAFQIGGEFRDQRTHRQLRVVDFLRFVGIHPGAA